jgi:phosphotransferase system enzyme I (PtsI)
VFLVQLRALARAATVGNLKVMLPMVTTPRELVEARTLFESAVDRLRAAGTKASLPPLGMMVEVPSAAIAIDRFDAAFLSIGTNDLAQYVTACDRSNGMLADLCSPLDPAVLALIRDVADHGRRRGLEVSVCGDMAADPSCIAALLVCGVRTLSVAPAALGRVKAAIASYRGGPCV